MTELLLVKLDNIHDSSSSSLVILGLSHSLGSNDVVSGLELRVGKFVGETSSADGNTSQHTVALVLVHHKARLNSSGDLVGVGDNTTDKVRLSLVQSGHQVIKLALEVGGDSLATSLLLSVLILGSLQRLSRMISEALDQHGIGSILHHLDNSVIERILVLLQPSSQVVGDSGGIMDNTKVSIGVTHLWVGLAEVGLLAEQVVEQLGSEGLISGLGEERLLLKDGQQAHGLLKHVNARLQVHAKVAVGPVQTFLNIFLLLKGEHVLVEELLELLIDIVDTNLLESVELKNLETGNIQDTNVGDLLHCRVNQSLITLVNNNSEGSLVDSTSNTTDRVGSSSTGGALGDPLSSNL